jgi:hypothetical protein
MTSSNREAVLFIERTHWVKISELRIHRLVEDGLISSRKYALYQLRTEPSAGHGSILGSYTALKEAEKL